VTPGGQPHADLESVLGATLRGSNPLSSAPLTRQNAGPTRHGRPGVRVRGLSCGLKTTWYRSTYRALTRPAPGSHRPYLSARLDRLADIAGENVVPIVGSFTAVHCRSGDTRPYSAQRRGPGRGRTAHAGARQGRWTCSTSIIRGAVRALGAGAGRQRAFIRTNVAGLTSQLIAVKGPRSRPIDLRSVGTKSVGD